jgi:hypothetical protein
MGESELDWRLTGQETYLKGVSLVRKPYRAYSGQWEHDHCEFCTAKFMDAAYSEAHSTFIEEHPEVLTEGYATTADGRHGADYYWICPRCFDDFAGAFEWRVQDANSS